jgi:ubiquinone biosynthesis protein UbiJ
VGLRLVIADRRVEVGEEVKGMVDANFAGSASAAQDVATKSGEGQIRNS